MTPYVLLLSAVMVLAPLARSAPLRLWGWLAAVGIATFSAEVLGVHTGAVFGNYHYGEVLGTSWLGVPLVIAVNWSVVTLGAVCAAGLLSRRPWVLVPVATALAVLLDVLLEPVAMALGYWHWENDTIPLQNYLAWGILGGSSAIAWCALSIRVSPRVPAAYLFILCGYFLILCIAL